MRVLPSWGSAIVGMATCLSLTAPAAGSTGDAARGKSLYESRCTACHSLDQSRIGPAHRGVYGRHAARVVGFDYSPALKKANIIWNARTLDRWLKDPEASDRGCEDGLLGV